MKPNQPFNPETIRSLVSILTFIFLVIAVGFLSVNFGLALLEKFS